VNFVLPAFLLAFCLLPAVAHADLYAYVDEEGKMHFAQEKLDERYELFVKSETSQVRPTYQMSTELKYLPGTGRLEDHIIYKRIQKTPNVKKFETLVLAEARRQQLDPALVKAVIAVESAYDPAAVSPKGAIGLMQLIPATAERYGIKTIEDPKSNIGGGTRYLKDLIEMFGGNLTLALAGYNAGEGAVRQYKNAVPPYPETQQYVKLVMQFYEYFGGRAGKMTRGPDGRIRLTIPGRRNLPPGQGESAMEQLARDPRAQELLKAPAEGAR
jgi:soluble lytic murein transglycosylase-like protein